MLRRSTCLLAVAVTTVGLAALPTTVAVAVPNARIMSAPHALPWSATAHEVRARALSGHRAELSWATPREADYAGMIIRRMPGIVAPTASTGIAIARVGAHTHTYVDAGVSAGRTYSYAVFARNAAGRIGPAARATVRVPADRPAARPAHAAPSVAPKVAGKISGTVTDASTSTGIDSLDVAVYDGGGNYVTDTYTTSGGSYLVPGLAPSATGYTVCFVGVYSGPTGYLNECYNDVPWDGDYYNLPGGTTPVPVTAGVTTSGIDAALAPAGAIAGRVTAAADGSPLSNVTIDVYSADGNYATSTSTDDTGRYRATGLATGSYFVCFSGGYATGGPSVYGYLSVCYRNRPYNGFDLPSGMTSVSVTAGVTHASVLARLGSAGAIAGTVRAADSTPVDRFDVSVFDLAGNQVSYGQSDGAGGTYTVSGLEPGSYDVCFGNASGGSSTTGYQPECYADVAWDGYSAPSDATAVPVAAGAETDGIDEVLDAASVISGAVTSASTGTGIRAVDVEVLNGAGDFVAGTSTRTDGTYRVEGLQPSAAGYSVCFGTSGARGGGSTTGYLQECYDDVPWSGYDLPSGVTLVPVAAGATVAGIDAQLDVAGAIGGKVTAASDGAPLADVDVLVFDLDGSTVKDTTTYSTGSYRINGLAPSSSGYVVCFDGSHAGGGTSAGGYRSQCYLNKPWSGEYYEIPATAAHVSVATGATHSSVNGKLVAGGAIGGVVTAVDGGSALADVDVHVVKPNGDSVGEVVTGEDGRYRVSGLAASTSYRVCFDGSYAGGGPSATGYLNECYDNVPWPSGDVPAGADSVAVAAGARTSGISASLADAGAISGRVTATATGHGITDVEVDVYDSSDNLVASAYTQSSGQYRLTGLAANASGYAVCFNAYSASGGGVTTGFLDECYDNVPWDGYSDATAAATPVPVAAGSDSSGIDAGLTSAGAIAGRVAAASDGTGIEGVDVTVLTGGGDYVADAWTGADGTYRIIGITASAVGYVVCFDAGNATGGPSSTGYLSECYDNQPWSPGTEAPAGVTLVSVSAGAVHGGVAARLRNGAAIEGTVTAASDGAPVGDVGAYVWNGSDFIAGAATSEVDGTYRLVGLPAGTVRVCFDAAGADAAPSTGYADECWSNAAWDGARHAVPADARGVMLRSGTTASNVDAALDPGGAIAGQLTTLAGNPASAGFVEVFDGNGILDGAQSDSTGNYRVPGVNPAAGPYTVCFQDIGDHTGSSTGWAPQCYQGIPWVGNGAPPPAGTTDVSVSAGGTTTGISAVLRRGGAITGTVTDANSGDPVPGIYPVAFDTSGHRVAGDYTGDTGMYRFNGLAPGQYVVCFSDYSDRYAPQCWNDLGWDGIPEDIPSDATVITVTANGVQSGIDAALGPPPQ